MQPRTHQKEAVDACIAALEDSPRAQIHMACGSGKTFVAALARQKMAARTVVFLAPTIKLCEQASRLFEPTRPASSALMFVCSPNDPRIQGVQPSTDVDAIADRLRDVGQVEIFSTYASAAALGSALRLAGRNVDLAIGDEAHRSAGDARRRYSQWLRDSTLACDKRLSMTATPRFVNGGFADQKIYSMDDFDAFGDVAFQYPFAAAVADGVVSDIDALIALAETGQDEPSLTELLAAKAQAVARAMAEYNLTGLLSYHGRIDEAAEFARLLRAQGIGAAHVHGHMAVSTVNRQLKRLVSGSPFVLCNAKLLGEGIDVPAVDGVILNTAKKSVVDITQAIGRAARRTPGKDRGYVILPLHCAKRENFEAAILSQQYAFTWQALLRLFDIYQMPDRSTDLTPESSIEARQPTIRVIGKTAPGAAIDQLIQRFTEVRRLSLAQFVWMQKANNLLTHLRAGDGVVTSGLNDWLCYNRKRAAAGDLPADQIAVLDEIQHLIDERKSDVTNIRSRRLEAYVEAIESGARLTIDINSLQSLAENRNIHSDLHKRYLRIRYNRAAEDLKKMMAAVAAYGQPNASKKHKAIYDRIRDNPNDYPELWRELLAARQARKNRNMREIQEYLAAVEAGQPATQNARIYGRIMAHPEIYKAEIARLRAAKAANGVTRPRPAVGKLLAVINDKWSSTDQIAGALGKQRKTTYTLLMKALLRGQVERRRGDGSLYLWRRSVARRSAGDDLLS